MSLPLRATITTVPGSLPQAMCSWNTSWMRPSFSLETPTCSGGPGSRLRLTCDQADDAATNRAPDSAATKIQRFISVNLPKSHGELCLPVHQAYRAPAVSQRWAAVAVSIRHERDGAAPFVWPDGRKILDTMIRIVGHCDT